MDIDKRINILERIFTEDLLNKLNTKEDNKLYKFFNDADISTYSSKIILRKEHFKFDNIFSIFKSIKFLGSGSHGFAFVCLSHNNLKCSMKIVISDNDDIRSPVNSEINTLWILTNTLIMKKKNPYICIPVIALTSQVTENLKNLFEGENIKTDKGSERIKHLIESVGCDISVLFCEYADSKTLSKLPMENNSRTWKLLLFQIIYCLYIIQKTFPSFRHNDLKPNNILLIKNNTNYTSFNCVISGVLFNVPICEYNALLWDFDFSYIPGLSRNLKVELKWANDALILPVRNKYYDIFYIFNILAKYVPRTKEYSEMLKFLKKYILTGPIKDKQRQDNNIEYTTPEVILHDGYFLEFRRTDANPSIKSLPINKEIKEFSTKKFMSCGCNKIFKCYEHKKINYDLLL